MSKSIEEKIGSGRQYRSMKEIRAEAKDDKKTVNGYATTFNEPYTLFTFGDYTVREQVDPHAFDACDMSDVIMQYDHASRVFARTSNKTLELTVDDHGLFISADLGGTEIGRNLYEEIRGGYTTKMSFGFTVAEESRLETEDKDTGKIDILRTITKIGKLYDVSAVSLPANDGTAISARHFCEGVIAEIEAERLRAEEERKARQDIINKIKIEAERI